MGSSTSRLSSPSISSNGSQRPTFRLASLFCGTYFSDDPPPSPPPPPPHQLVDQPNDVYVHALHVVDDEPQNSIIDSSLTFPSEGQNFGLSAQNASSGHQSSSVPEKMVVNYGSSSAETSSSSKCFDDNKEVETSSCYNHNTESKELITCGKDVDNCVNDIYSGRIGDQPLPSIKSIPFRPSSIIRETISPPAVEGDSTTTEPGSSNHVSQQEHDSLSSNEIPSARNQVVQLTTVEPVREETSLISGFHRTIVQGGQGNVLHVDVVSISSDILTSSREAREARRNSRRLFWDAFSRQSARSDDAPPVSPSTESSDDLGSRRRWLNDFSDDSDNSENWIRNEARSLNRRHNTYEHRRRSRSELWERLRGGLDESSGNATLCASGLHPEGTCSCESLLMAEISSARASISRIVLLAEALFEVLDEIHRQPESLSLSMVSHPAPESIVNSFPLKNYEKCSTLLGSGQGVEQCNICLDEYEEEDTIRVLPCQHEYHMSCVDKWLKEIHGICPLCRRNVCEGITTESTASNS